jgi:hypothetical protein
VTSRAAPGRSSVAKAAGATAKAKKPSMPSHSAIETMVKVLIDLDGSP